jgi:hypothetical protein
MATLNGFGELLSIIGKDNRVSPRPADVHMELLALDEFR